MQIPGISANDPLSNGSAASSNELGKDAFMKLLVNQLKNQDPLDPNKAQDSVAQLAQFSSLEQMQQLNDNIVGLAVLQQSNALLSQLTSSSALIGKQVEYVDPSDQSHKWGSVDSVRIEDGIATLQIGGASVPLANVLTIGTPPTTPPATPPANQ
jgi:flagellar basal-body rod modification protein FlgD